MKEILVNLKNDIDPYYSELRAECELLPLVYDSLELIINLDVPDDVLNDWYNSNKTSIELIKNKLDKITQQ